MSYSCHILISIMPTMPELSAEIFSDPSQLSEPLEIRKGGKFIIIIVMSSSSCF